MLGFRQIKRFMQRKDAQLFAVSPDYPDFFSPYGLIDAYRRFSYGITS